MTKEESDGFLRGIASVMKEQIEAATAPLRAELEALKARPIAPPVEVREVNEFDPEFVKNYMMSAEAESIICGHVSRTVQTIKGEPGVAGKDGRDGRDAAPLDMELLTATVLKRIPPPEQEADLFAPCFAAELTRSFNEAAV